MKFCDYFSVVLQIVAGYFATWFKTRISGERRKKVRRPRRQTKAICIYYRCRRSRPHVAGEGERGILMGNERALSHFTEGISAEV